MGQLLSDLRHGVRALVKNPGFSVLTVLILALGIGANTAVFSAVDAVLLRDLPYREPGRLAMVWLDNSRLGVRQDITSYPNFLDWRDNAVFDEMAVYSVRRHNLTGEGAPERLRIGHVMAGFFELLGASPSRGRTFTPEEDVADGPRVAIVSHGLWQRRYGADPGLVGSTIRLDGVDHTVVGVMPEGFAFPEVEAWVPLAASPNQRAEGARFGLWLYTVGRLRHGVSPRRAQAAMDAVAERLAAEHPEMEGYGIYVQPLRDYLAGDVGPALVVLLAAVAAVLLIACANVANLLLARAASRERELAVRAALGAGRARIVRQLMAETAVLSLAGGSLGLLLAAWGVELLLRLCPPRLAAELAGGGGIAVDARVLMFAVAASLGTVLLAGLLPALQASRPHLTPALRGDGRGVAGSLRGHRTRQALVAAEVAAALVLLIAAGLLVRSLRGLQGVDPGLRGDGVLLVDLSLPRASYDDDAKVTGFYQSLLERTGGLPGVESVAAGSQVLLPELPNSGTITVEGRPDPPVEQRIEVTVDAVTPGYFEILGIQRLRGRTVSPHDQSEPNVAVINHAMAHRFWPGEDPVGRRFQFGDADEAQEDGWITVIGVVADARRSAVEHEARPSVFFPHPVFPTTAMTLLMRTASDPLALSDAVRREVHALDPDLPVQRVTTLGAQLEERLAERRFHSMLLGLFSILALVLALAGIYGVISHSVGQRLPEIGIRVALGARPGRVTAAVMGRGLVPVAVGAAVGLGVASAVTRLLARFLYGVAPWDPPTYGALVGLLMLVSAGAILVPARRAAKSDPLRVLRTG